MWDVRECGGDLLETTPNDVAARAKQAMATETRQEASRLARTYCLALDVANPHNTAPQSMSL